MVNRLEPLERKYVKPHEPTSTPTLNVSKTPMTTDKMKTQENTPLEPSGNRFVDAPAEGSRRTTGKIRITDIYVDGTQIQ